MNIDVNPSPPTENAGDTLNPGQGVVITKSNDPNFQRDGHIRKMSDPTNNEYKVVFEPGEEGKYHRYWLSPSGHNVDPLNLPPETKLPGDKEA